MTSQNENKKVGTNPIITSIYTADPAPMVSGDTLYLYTTHDEDQLINDFYTMNDWRCYSTKDMVNWEDHGAVFSLDDISWAQDRVSAAGNREKRQILSLLPCTQEGRRHGDSCRSIRQPCRSV